MSIDYSYNDAVVNAENLKVDPFMDSWMAQEGSVLLDDKIMSYCEEQSIKLIFPFNKNKLKSASYKLSLGKRCRVGRDDQELSESDPMLFIPPHGIAMVETYEWINLPGYLIARWNLDTHKVYKGLVWVGGPQVDPGFQGHLSCPIYNLSNLVQKIKYKEPIFIIDFIHTSNFNNNKNKIWSSERKTYSPAWGPLDEDKILSAPAETNRKVEEAKKEVEAARESVRSLQAIVIVLMTIIISAIAVLATMNSLEPIKVPSDWTNVGPAWLSVIAFALSLALLLYVIIQGKNNKRS